jgi:hypothetical protein
MKYFSLNKNYNDILVTLMVLIFLGAGYFYVYVPQNEKRVQEQRFRSLQNIDKNIHAKIDNSISLMNNLLQSYKNGDKQFIITYIKKYSKDNFTLSLPDSQKIAPAGTDSAYSIIISNNNRQITLLANVQRNRFLHDSVVYRMDMKFSFEQFIKYLLPSNVFDQYIVFSNGQVVYEDFSSGIGFLNDSLSGKTGGIVSSGIKSLNVSGKDYRLFFQPVSFTADKQLVVTGLLSNRHYQQEKNQLPSQGVLLLLTFVFIAIVAYPWIKLYQMGNTDRLTVADGIATIVVSMLLVSLLFFTFVKYNLSFRPDGSPDSKDTLATQITGAFKTEIDSIYRKIRFYDEAVKAHPDKFHKDIVYLDKDSIAAKDKNNDSLYILSAVAKNAAVNQVFWLDKNGDEQVNWISGEINAPHGNFSQRAYFKNIVQNNPYLLNADTARPYYLDQIISWTSGAFTSVISIPSAVPGLKVASLSFKMRSLQHPLLPAGYQFAVIDGNAKVLYHSDASRNLNENLLSEFSETERLKSCLEARIKDVFTTTYFSREYNVSVTPVNSLPYFIIIFGDTSYKETRDVEIYTFTFSMMLLLFLFLIFQLFSVFIVSSKRSFFKKQLFDTSWVGPKISSHNQYNIAAVANLLVFSLSVIFFNFSTILTYLFILFFSVIFTSVFLNAVFAKRYKKNNETDNYRFKIVTIRWLLVCIIVTNLVAICTLDFESMLVLWLYELLVIITGCIIFVWGKLLVNKIFIFINSSFLSPENYAYSFTLMAVTRLLLTSGLPVLFFYITSYNYEQNISIRYRHLQYAKSLPGNLTRDKLNAIVKQHHTDGSYYYFDGAWIKNIGFKENDTVANYTREELITTELLGLFRINISDKAVNEDKFYTVAASDTSFFYNPLLKKASKGNNATSTYLQTSNPDKYLSITASGLNYKLPSLYGESFLSGWLFWLLLLAVLVFFYFIIYNVLNKLFCLRLPELALWSKLDDTVLGNEKVNNLLFVIGVPGSGKLTRILEKIKNGGMQNGSNPLVFVKDNDAQSNVVIADLINIPDFGDQKERDTFLKNFTATLLNEKNKLIIVNHFEYNIQDAATNRMKLNLLEQVMLPNKCKVIILSTIHPMAFLDSITDQLIPSQNTVPGQDLERWHVLLGHYRIVIFGLESSAGIPAEYEEEVYKSVFKETAHTHFLNKMRESLITVAGTFPQNKKEEKGDEMVFKLQVMSHYFYMYIWQSLTKEEKFLMYDLAEDNLVNSFDDYNLTMLIAKGVIVRIDGTLRIFNRGFRNFILTAIGNSEAVKIKKLIKDNGNWGKLKNPLMIVIVAILIFLLLSQEEAYSKLITYIAALGAGIPAVIKLFSFFDNTGSKS